MARDRAAFAAALFGLATLAVFIGFQILPAVRAAGECIEQGSLVAFQRARDMEALRDVFGAPASACRAPALNAIDALNTLDLFLFIPVYALFLMSAVAMLAKGVRAPLALLAIAAVLAGVAGDVHETMTQLRMTRDIDASAPLIPALTLGYWVKYAGLAAHAVVAGLIALRARRWILAGLGLLTGIATIAAALDFVQLMTTSFALFWSALLAVALAAILRRPATDRSPA